MKILIYKEKKFNNIIFYIGLLILIINSYFTLFPTTLIQNKLFLQ